jgi:hypothetical protein
VRRPSEQALVRVALVLLLVLLTLQLCQATGSGWRDAF